MPQELYSVDQVADQLGLHVRTIRKYIRAGRLKAVRIGKQYRVARTDLEAFTGGPVAGSVRRVEVSSIVQLDGVDRVAADRISTFLISAVNSPQDDPLRVQTIYSEDNAGLKVIVVGDLTATADLLRVIAALADDSRQ